MASAQRNRLTKGGVEDGTVDHLLVFVPRYDHVASRSRSWFSLSVWTWSHSRQVRREVCVSPALILIRVGLFPSSFRSHDLGLFFVDLFFRSGEQEDRRRGVCLCCVVGGGGFFLSSLVGFIKTALGDGYN